MAGSLNYYPWMSDFLFRNFINIDRESGVVDLLISIQAKPE